MQEFEGTSARAQFRGLPLHPFLLQKFAVEERDSCFESVTSPTRYVSLTKIKKQKQRESEKSERSLQRLLVKDQRWTVTKRVSARLTLHDGLLLKKLWSSPLLTKLIHIPRGHPPPIEYFNCRRLLLFSTSLCFSLRYQTDLIESQRSFVLCPSGEIHKESSPCSKFGDFGDFIVCVDV